ncbi:MAG: Lon protease family protein [Cellulosilyticaceae bacterium]
MKKKLELKWNQLKKIYELEKLNFNTTDDLEIEERMLNQDDADEILDFGLKMKAPDYNIYVSGQDEKIIYDYVVKKVTEQAKEEPVPNDICYIYNFKKPTTPKVLELKAGLGKSLANDMEELKYFLTEELSEKLSNPTMVRMRRKINKELASKQEELIKGLRVKANEKGYDIQLSEKGIVFFEIENKEDENKEDEKNNKSKSINMKEILGEVYDESEEIILQIEELEKQYKNKLEDLDIELLIKEVSSHMDFLKNKYKKYIDIRKYINEIIGDIVENSEVFLKKNKEEDSNMAQMLQGLATKKDKEVAEKYSVNVVVDNSELKYAPVVTGYPVTYNHLMGHIAVDQELGIEKINHMNIKQGMLHRAHGGYLIIKMKDLIENLETWEGLKLVLRTETIMMENTNGNNIVINQVILPEYFKVNLKVILVGEYVFYNALYEQDMRFREVVKINANFGSSVDNSEEKIVMFAKLIKTFCEKNKLPKVSRDGVLKLLEYNQRYAESSEKLSANMQYVYDMLREATVFTKDLITEEVIKKVKQIKNKFKENIQKITNEQYEKNVLLIDTKGKKVGQINGLAVMEIENFMVGQPTRITVTTYRGQSGVVDIESKVGLSGNIHSKGVQIINGFLGHYFAKDYPLSLSCRICFEQNYGGIDGDSASSTELYALLSSLSGIPIKQNFAVTGSVNQYGEIQPIGGVNDKIEGFYKVCKKKGLTGTQGVVMPYQNVQDLVLDDEVVEAVRCGEFHIYAVKSFKEGIEILTGKKYEEIETLIKEKLKSYSEDNMYQKNIQKEFE